MYMVYFFAILENSFTFPLVPAHKKKYGNSVGRAGSKDMIFK